MDITEHGPTDGSRRATLLDHPTPDNPPWSSGIAIIVWVISVLLILIVPSLVVLAYVAPMRGQFADQEAIVEFVKNDPWAVVLQVGAIIPVHLLTLLISWLVVTRFRKYSFSRTLGFELGGMRWWHYLVILAAFFAFASVVTSYYPEANNDMIRMLNSSRTAVFIVAALATFTAPLVEEVVYRGLLYSALQRTFGAAGGVAAVTAIFAGVHIPQYWPSFSTLGLVTVLSLILTIVRARTGNLLPAIILHTIFNGLQSALLIAEPYISRPAANPESIGAIFINLFAK